MVSRLNLVLAAAALLLFSPAHALTEDRCAGFRTAWENLSRERNDTACDIPPFSKPGAEFDFFPAIADVDSAKFCEGCGTDGAYAEFTNLAARVRQAGLGTCVIQDPTSPGEREAWEVLLNVKRAFQAMCLKGASGEFCYPSLRSSIQQEGTLVYTEIDFEKQCSDTCGPPTLAYLRRWFPCSLPDNECRQEGLACRTKFEGGYLCQDGCEECTARGLTCEVEAGFISCGGPTSADADGGAYADADTPGRYQTSCTGVQCGAGQTCWVGVSGSEAVCVDADQICAAVGCEEDQTCQRTNVGVFECMDAVADADTGGADADTADTDPDTQRCERCNAAGMRCERDDDGAFVQCVDTTRNADADTGDADADTAGSALCERCAAAGFECEAGANGRVVCAGERDPCATLQCQAPLTCRIARGGVAECVDAVLQGVTQLCERLRVASQNPGLAGRQRAVRMRLLAFMNIPLEEFTAEVQQGYILAIASVTGVDSSDISIEEARAASEQERRGGAARRADAAGAGGILVDTRVQMAPDFDSSSMDVDGMKSAIKNEMNERGMQHLGLEINSIAQEEAADTIDASPTSGAGGRVGGGGGGGLVYVLTLLLASLSLRR